MADQLAGGHLVRAMTDAYAESGSWEDVSRRLYRDHGIQVSGQTLRRWAADLGIGEAVA